MAEIHQIEATFDSLDLLGKGELLGLRDGFLKLREWAAAGVEAEDLGDDEWTSSLELPPET